MAAPTPQHHIRLARTLPPRLLSFLARHPPSLPISLSSTTTLHSPQPTPTIPPTQNPQFNPLNPHPPPPSLTHPPRHPYSHRRTSTLLRLAHAHKIRDLLPPSPLDPITQTEALVSQGGFRGKGTGVGQKVRGRQWERTLKSKLERRRQAMLGMEKLVLAWKRAGHGRGNKKLKWPSGKKGRAGG